MTVSRAERLAQKKRYREVNKEKIAAYQRAYRQKNRQYVRELNRESYERNKNARLLNARRKYIPKGKPKLSPEEDASRRRARTEAWRKKNKAIRAAQQRARVSAKLNATPPWANLGKIQRVYELAGWASRFTDQPLHVDHIIPLRGIGICGLHVWENLQILQRSTNCSKGNAKWKDYVDPNLVWR